MSQYRVEWSGLLSFGAALIATEMASAAATVAHTYVSAWVLNLQWLLGFVSSGLAWFGMVLGGLGSGSFCALGWLHVVIV